MPHNPLKFAAGLSAKLAARSRHVCTFFGAGTSRACGLPDVSQLQTRVLENLNESERALFGKQLESGNLEHALSRLRRIRALIQGETQLDGLTHETASELDLKVCQAIVKGLASDGADKKPALDFAAWVARSNYLTPLEIFTVNYDLLLEEALEAWQVPYFDGFVGTLKARFKTELVEALPGSDSMPAFFARLWKLHGSLNWEWDEEYKILRRGMHVEKSAAIYPSDTKYDESRRMPFVVLQDRFRRSLYQPETLAIISGYSFADAHINEIIFDAAMRRQRSEIVVFCFDDIPDSLAQRAIVTPNIQVVSGTEAIIGGTRALWEAPEDVPPDLWQDGTFKLPDFRHLAAYLAKSASIGDEPSVLLKIVQAVGTEGIQVGNG